jgi:hypothetical protein
VVIKLNDECLLTNVGGDALQLKGLENSPVKKFLMSGGKFPQVLDHTFVVLTADWLHLSGGMLTDRFM